MFDIDALLSLSIVILGTLGWAAFLRLVRGSEPVDLGSIFSRPWELAWPRGVQEEEPVPWRLARPDRRPALLDAPPVADEACTCQPADVAA